MRVMKVAAMVFGGVLALAMAASAQELPPPVQDITPPTVVSAIPDQPVLWPPNHKMITVNVSAVVTDDTDPAPTWKIIEVTSDEPVDATDPAEAGTGETAVATSPDWVIVDNNTVQLRAERLGSGDGRTYTIIVEATDAFGNTSTGTATVIVPHDQGDVKDLRKEAQKEKKLFQQQQKAAKKAAKELAKHKPAGKK